MRLAILCLFWLCPARAACPSGTTPANSEAYQSCDDGRPVAATVTYCEDKSGVCVSQFFTVESKVFDCASCSDCNAGESAAGRYAETLCGPRVSCGDGTCGGGQKCCSGRCVSKDGACCGNGACENGACGDGHCCPDGYSVFDADSGYCCGALGTAPDSCGCETQCDSGCCGAGLVCCGGGWCAPSTSQCPGCAPGLTTACPDGSCAPPFAICCGGGYYCPNGHACLDGNMCDGGLKAAKTALPVGANGGTYTSQKPSGAPVPGDEPQLSPLDPKHLPGCNCELGGGAPAPFALVLLFILAWLVWLRRLVR